MAANLLPVLVAGGGVAYLATQAGDAPAVRPPGPPRGLAPTAGSTVTQAAQQGALTNPNPPPGTMVDYGGVSYGSGTASLYWGAFTPEEQKSIAAADAFSKSPSAMTLWITPEDRATGWGTAGNIDPGVQEKLDLAESYLKEQWENANEVAKAAAADKLNKEMKLDPPLTGHETWGDMLAIVAGAAATAACAATGYGAVVAPICGIVAAWLGQKFGDWFEKKWPAIKAWAQERWNDVEDAANEAYDWFASAF